MHCKSIIPIYNLFKNRRIINIPEETNMNAFNEISPQSILLLKKMKLPPVSQIGLVVEDIEKAAQYYGALLNIKNWYVPHLKSHESYYKEKFINQKFSVVLGYSAKIQIELIHQECEEENLYNAVLGRNNYGFHHLGVTVGNLDKNIEILKQAGIPPVQTGIMHTSSGVTKYAYLDTLHEAGFIFELIESRAFGINIGMPEWLMKTGRMTGDVKKL